MTDQRDRALTLAKEIRNMVIENPWANVLPSVADLIEAALWEQSLTFPFPIMILCPKCGNKRCPKAEHYRFKCTGSNDTKQVYEVDDDTPT